MTMTTLGCGEEDGYKIAPVPQVGGAPKKTTCKYQKERDLNLDLSSGSSKCLLTSICLVQLLVPCTVSKVQGLMDRIGETGLMGWICDKQLFQTSLILTCKNAGTPF